MKSGFQGLHWLLLFVSFSKFIPNGIKGKKYSKLHSDCCAWKNVRGSDIMRERFKKVSEF